jgi:hypothetical protein
VSENLQLSVVAASRNDNHGGNLQARMQLFIDGFADQAERFGYGIELIVVEWNPPADRPSLAEALRWNTTGHFHPRIVTVPRQTHDSFPHSDRLPLFQMIAKNAGIRRARAPFILATNIDILLSDELAGFLGSGLRPNTMYRADRSDVIASLDGPRLPTPAECRALAPIREHRFDGMRYPDGDVPPLGRRSLRPDRWAGLALSMWYRMRLPRLHTSGCGDFMLASRELWNAIHGYPEWPMFSWHLDGLGLFQAYAAGAEMVNLQPPKLAIHLEHSSGSGWTPEGSESLFSRLDRSGVPYLSTNAYRRWARKLVRNGRGAAAINRDDWGLASFDLPEATPAVSAGEVPR